MTLGHWRSFSGVHNPLHLLSQLSPHIVTLTHHQLHLHTSLPSPLPTNDTHTHTHTHILSLQPTVTALSLLSPYTYTPSSPPFSPQGPSPFTVTTSYTYTPPLPTPHSPQVTHTPSPQPTVTPPPLNLSPQTSLLSSLLLISSTSHPLPTRVICCCSPAMLPCCSRMSAY